MMGLHNLFYPIVKLMLHVFQRTCIFNKFINVNVTFQGTSDSVMVWQFDNSTTADYNTKTAQGNYVLWDGWPVDAFSKCKFVLVKRSRTLTDLVHDAAAN